MNRSIAAAAGLLSACALLLTSNVAASAKPAPATLTATPGVVTYTDSNAYETFTGCGYQPSTITTIVVNTPSAVSFFGGSSNTSGCIDIAHNGFIDLSGTYYVQAWQNNARTGKSTLMAKTTFTVG
ncbi:MAG: hypothetical protein QOG80_818 [Pseudonocardiales bacterium]|jgi:hypothetical protein|nr:hypothetical protein [Pseudonocardiales bacterium]